MRGVYDRAGFDLEGIYLRLPIPLQNVASSAVGLRTQFTRYDRSFSRMLTEALDRTYWPLDATLEYRDRRLALSIRHAAQTAPFYAQALRSAGLVAADVRTLDDLGDLPVLTRRNVQEHLRRMVSTAVPARKARMLHTGGTTGGALRFPTTMRAIQEQWAILWRYRAWHGIDQSVWSALFAGRSVVPAHQRKPPFWRFNLPGRQLLFSGYHMAPGNLPDYASELRRRRPPWLHGYPSLLALLAAYIVDAGFDLGYEPRWVTTGAENLLPHQIDVIRRAFGVKPLQHYGQTEGVAEFSECERGSLHVDEDFSAVEFLPIGDSGQHRIVGTNLANPATPLIRYDTGDVAVLRPDATCSCGRPGRVVEHVDGRLEDYVILANGVRIGRMDHIFKDMINVQEAQIYQERPGSIALRVVRGRNFGDRDEDALRRETEKRVGDQADVEIEYWDTLPRTSNGKLRFVVSEIESGSIHATDLAGNDA